MNKGWLGQVYLMELRKIITYRADFWVNFVGQTLFSILISYFLWFAIFEANGSDRINGFTLNKIIFYYLIVPITFRIQQGETIGSISGDIYEGRLNKFLLYPISFYYYKLTTYLAHSTFFLVQLIFLTLIYYFGINSDQDISITLLNFSLFVFILIISSVTYFFMNSIAELVSFWADNTWSLGVMIRFFTSFFGGALIPLSFFPEWAVKALAYTPFPYIIDFPMKVFFGEFTASLYITSILTLIGWTLFFGLISNIVWSRGRYHYSGIGI